MTRFADEALFYGFRPLKPVTLGQSRATTARHSLDGSPLFTRQTARGSFVSLTFAMTDRQLAEERGDGGMDFATRLEWLAAQPGPVTVRMVQNVVQPATANKSASGAAAAGASAVNLRSAGGTIAVGRFVSFAGHSVVYRVTESSATRIGVSPPLRDGVANGEAVNATPNVAVVMVSDPLVTVGRNGILQKTVVLNEAF